MASVGCGMVGWFVEFNWKKCMYLTTIHEVVGIMLN